jgi:hypothetical protein
MDQTGGGKYMPSFAGAATSVEIDAIFTPGHVLAVQRIP